MKKTKWMLFIFLISSLASFWNACSNTKNKEYIPNEIQPQDSGVEQKDSGVEHENQTKETQPEQGTKLSEIIKKFQAAISQKRITADGTWMTSDLYKGRNNNTAASKQTQTALIKIIKELGISPLGNSFRHPFTGKAPGTNIIGQWKGNDPKLSKEIVVIGAHYDHLGQKKDGTIYRGASDNALGVAIILEIARTLASNKFKPARTIIFAFWDSEEDGLKGSTSALEKKHLPTEQVVAYLNLRSEVS